MPLQPGTKLGPYEILASIRAGDTQAYKASDTRLERPVAIKLLPPEFSANPEWKERLERVSQTIASLKHPNICALVDVARHDGVDYVVSEYLEGETLADRLQRGPLELEEALKVAIAIADALDKAHRHGVTHRCLNPVNVVLTANGPKLLDFGLAKLTESSGPTASASSLSTHTAAAATLAAVPSFAAPYVAPEQWSGSQADARTDVFALGAILYEMIAGKPAFEGKTPALLIAAIETIDPEPLSKVQPITPAALDHVVKRCLMKDPKRRFQTAWDLLSQLRWIADNSAQLGVSATRSAAARKRDRVVWIALALVSLLAVMMAPATYRYLQGAPESADVHFLLPDLGAAVPGPPLSVSPDGRWIGRSFGGTNRGLDSVLLSSATRQVLLTGNVITQPFWSPDSRSVGFFEDGKLKRADVSGGPSQNICEAPPPFGSGTWNRDGVILFSGAGVLQRVLATGGQPTPVTTLDQSKQETEHLAPYFLPDGRHYLYLVVSSQPSESAIYVGSLDSKERTRLFPSESRAIYAAPGYVLFSRGDALFAQGFDERKLALTGEPVRIADGISGTGNTVTAVAANVYRTASFAVSQSGVLAYRIGPNQTPQAGPYIVDRTLIWFDRSGKQIGQVGGPASYAGVDLSPDGKQVAVHVHDSSGGDSWFFDAAQARMQRLTFDAAQDNSMPVWSPDGMRVAFGSRRNGKWGLYLKLTDGTAKEELLTESDLPKMPMSWSPDGKLLVYWVEDPKTRGDVWAVPVAGDRKPIPIVQTQANELNPQVSPDGKWIAYTSGETGRTEVYVKPFPEGPGKWQVSTDGGQWPRWRRDSKELFFNPLGPTIAAVDIRVTGASVQPGVPHVLFGINSNPYATAHSTAHNPFAVSADGQRFLIPQVDNGSTVSAGLADQLAVAADQGQSAATPNGVAVVLNWTRLLKPK